MTPSPPDADREHRISGSTLDRLIASAIGATENGHANELGNFLAALEKRGRVRLLAKGPSYTVRAAVPQDEREQISADVAQIAERLPSYTISGEIWNGLPPERRAAFVSRQGGAHEATPDGGTRFIGLTQLAAEQHAADLTALLSRQRGSRTEEFRADAIDAALSDPQKSMLGRYLLRCRQGGLIRASDPDIAGREGFYFSDKATAAIRREITARIDQLVKQAPHITLSADVNKIDRDSLARAGRGLGVHQQNEAGAITGFVAMSEAMADRYKERLVEMSPVLGPAALEAEARAPVERDAEPRPRSQTVAFYLLGRPNALARADHTVIGVMADSIEPFISLDTGSAIGRDVTFANIDNRVLALTNLSARGPEYVVESDRVSTIPQKSNAEQFVERAKALYREGSVPHIVDLNYHAARPVDSYNEFLTSTDHPALRPLTYGQFADVAAAAIAQERRQPGQTHAQAVNSAREWLGAQMDGIESHLGSQARSVDPQLHTELPQYDDTVNPPSHRLEASQLRRALTMIADGSLHVETSNTVMQTETSARAQYQALLDSIDGFHAERTYLAETLIPMLRELRRPGILGFVTDGSPLPVPGVRWFHAHDEHYAIPEKVFQSQDGTAPGVRLTAIAERMDEDGRNFSLVDLDLLAIRGTTAQDFINQIGSSRRHRALASLQLDAVRSLAADIDRDSRGIEPQQTQQIDRPAEQGTLTL